MRIAEERQAGLDRRIELETADGNTPPHFTPAVALDQLVEDVFQRDAVQRIAGMICRRGHEA